MLENKTILILSPGPKLPGGVANYYQLFKKHKDCITCKIDFLYVGTSLETPFSKKFYWSLKNIIKFLSIVNSYDIIQINPSLGFFRGMLRDAFYNTISKRIFSKKTIVFFRGWDENVAASIKHNKLRLFNWCFNCNICLVLSYDFKTTFENWKFPATKIIVETTTYEENISPTTSIKQVNNTLLFMSRFLKEKGGDLVLQTFSILKKELPHLTLYMAGDGPAKRNWETLSQTLNISDAVVFTGYVRGNEKYALLQASDILFFPTNYGEGMPNVILEALGFGLVIITKPAGGIKDVIEDGKQGWAIDSNSPEVFARLIISLYQEKNNKLLKQIAATNVVYAQQRFEIKKVLHRFQEYYDSL